MSTTLDNIIKVNMPSDTAIERINESFSKGKKTEKAEKSDKAEKTEKTEKPESEVDEEAAVSSESDETEDVAVYSDDSAYNKLIEFDYSKEETSFEIGDYIKKYTSAISNYLTYKAETSVPLGESPLKDVLKNKFKTNIAKSAYNDVGMGEYYNLKNALKFSQSLSSSQNNNKINSDIIKNFTNFSISV